ncbi:hypothetical protein [Streptomyces sp. NPDC056244]|uniref:hypothetical protein n=1 Tax=Streptomyces sp. NPDC056244 TaxID=3345762 RepID=UPI0035D666BD
MCPRCRTSAQHIGRIRYGKSPVPGSGLVVGLLYLAEGAVRRNLLHYSLGTWLALTSTAALFLGTPGLYWVLTVAGGGAYAIAAALERRRLARTSLARS